MRQRYWLGAAAAVLGAGLLTVSAQAAPAGAIGNDVRAAVGDAPAVQQAHYWGRRYYGGSYYGPRRYYRSYGYYRPYRYYGYGRGYRRGWW